MNVPEDRESIGQLFKLVSEDLITVRARWKLFVQLFGTNQQRFDLMRSTARSFFGHFQQILLDDTIMYICRLTDRASVAGGQNLSLGQVFTLVQPLVPANVAAELAWRLDRINQLRMPFARHRNKRLAHTDLRIRSAGDEILPGISRLMVETVLLEIAAFMNALEEDLFPPVTGYDRVITMHDAESLILAMKKAAEYDLLIEEDPVKWWSRLYESRYNSA